MAEPTSKTTRSRRASRRSHNAIHFHGSPKCPNCGSLVRSHRVCGTCGQYKKKEIFAKQ